MAVESTAAPDLVRRRRGAAPAPVQPLEAAVNLPDMIGGRGLAGSELAQHRQPADLRCPAANKQKQNKQTYPGHGRKCGAHTYAKTRRSPAGVSARESANLRERRGDEGAEADKWNGAHSSPSAEVRPFVLSRSSVRPSALRSSSTAAPFLLDTMRHVGVSFPPRQHALRPSTNTVHRVPDRFFSLIVCAFRY